MQQPLEIERKFLIAMPDSAWLMAQEGVTREGIEQTYLLSGAGEEVRVRRRGAAGTYAYVKTVKRALSGITREETETAVSKAEYDALLDMRDPSRRTIEKTRYSFPYRGHVLEIDVYPFWENWAILEAELQREDEALDLPEEIRIIREVTQDKRFKNSALAACADLKSLI
ncbi:MAG: CYTH domain-containing protein [Clostridia bacterium]|nr:CYTH domain-containing protein [Clostridia bacterium]